MSTSPISVLLQGTLNAAFPDDYASFAQCLQSTPQDQMEKVLLSFVSFTARTGRT